MDKILPVDFYGEADGLCGKRLKQGEMLRVQFPDGTVEPVRVKLLKESRTAQVDMTPHPDEFTTSIAYVETDFRGCKVQVRLRGLMAERMN